MTRSMHNALLRTSRQSQLEHFKGGFKVIERTTKSSRSSRLKIIKYDYETKFMVINRKIFKLEPEDVGGQSKVIVTRVEEQTWYSLRGRLHLNNQIRFHSDKRSSWFKHTAVCTQFALLIIIAINDVLQSDGRNTKICWPNLFDICQIVVWISE